MRTLKYNQLYNKTTFCFSYDQSIGNFIVQFGVIILAQIKFKNSVIIHKEKTKEIISFVK